MILDSYWETLVTLGGETFSFRWELGCSPLSVTALCSDTNL